MIGAVLGAALLLGAPPPHLTVATATGTATIPLWAVPGEGPLVPLAQLARSLGGRVSNVGERTILTLGTQAFQFWVDLPVMRAAQGPLVLPAPTRMRRDSTFVPLSFVAQVLADPTHSDWRWTAATYTLTTRPTTAPLAARPTPPAATSAPVTRRHLVTIDPGHGGTDPGNPGRFFPRGMQEKHVTLAVGMLVREELLKRGIDVRMTRSTDTLINLAHRAPRYCRTDCDLFVSIHVNALDAVPGYTLTRGFETYFLGVAKAADAARTARMENEAVRFEVPEPSGNSGDKLDFMFKDLQANAFLRASARAAGLIQTHIARVHNGTNRGVKQADFAVLTTARSPAILIELGFGTNTEDSRIMTTPAGQADLARAIASAIEAFLNESDAQTTSSQEHP